MVGAGQARRGWRGEARQCGERGGRGLGEAGRFRGGPRWGWAERAAASRGGAKRDGAGLSEGIGRGRAIFGGAGAGVAGGWEWGAAERYKAQQHSSSNRTGFVRDYSCDAHVEIVWFRR